MRRRDFVALSGYALLVPHAPALLARDGSFPARLTQDIAQIERRVGGRLGVAVYDATTGRQPGHRMRERFPLCSTFKLLLAAQVLSRAERGQERLSRMVPYGQSDLLEYAPVTRARVAEGGMTVSALIEAALEYSDNTAANLLLATVGGPEGLTGYLRSIGDDATRLDRIEPALNSAEPGDVRDTTTPDAMIADLRRILLGPTLTAAGRERLLAWLQANTTGARALRAGMPADWRLGDKTGSGGHGATNDVGMAWPPGRPPVLVAAYLAETRADATERYAALAGVGRAVGDWIAAGAPRR